jgi:uncharacterized membrane protein
MAETGEARSWATAPGWVKLLLVLSLSANVAVIGLIGGHAMRPDEHDRYGDEAAVPGLSRQQSRILQMVPEARREQAKAMLLARSAEIEAARAALQTSQAALIEALRQEPLDPARLDAALSERQAASGRVWGIGYEQMIEIARQLSPEERAAMASKLEERTQRWMERQAVAKN